MQAARTTLVLYLPGPPHPWDVNILATAEFTKMQSAADWVGVGKAQASHVCYFTRGMG
jgi:hypothetical protein